MKSRTLKCLAVTAFAGLMAQPASGATVVGLELSLLVDVSGSVDAAEFALQRDGYVAAFRNPAIHALITTLASQHGGGGMAVNYIEWDAAPSQSIGWTHLFDAASSNAFADLIAGTTFSTGSGTGLANAVNFAAPLFGTNDFDGVRQVIDVSGDGRDNRGPTGAPIDAATGAANTQAARDAALALGIDRINGLPILDEDGLLAFYTDNLVGGTNPFVLPVDNFADFAPAIERKIAAEIRDDDPTVPEGGPGLAVCGLVLAGVAGIHRRMARRGNPA